MPKKLTNIGLQNKVAEQLQLLVRLKAADKNGYVKCVTCGKVGFWEKDEMQGGHFIERGKIRLVEQNINCQCAYCNHHGMKKASTVLKYRAYMVDMYGEDFVQGLEQQANKPQKYSMPELRDLLKYYKNLIKEIKQEKGL